MNRQIIRDFLVDLSLAPRTIAARGGLRNSSAIGYMGWVGHANLGDEAMYEAISRALAPHRVLPLLPAPGERTLRTIGLSGAKRFGGALVGGGTLINRYYLELARFVVSWGVPLCVAGTGVGSPGFGFSFDDAKDVAGWVEILRRSPLVGIRGPESARVLEEAGVRNVEVIGDPALSLTLDVLPPVRARRRLVINLGPERGIRAGAVARVAADFAEAGGEVIGVALGAGDEDCLQSFRTRHGLREMSIESHRTSGEGLLRTLAGTYALISVRLHGAVLAACAGVPPVLFSYRAKCLDFMSSLDLDVFAVPVSAADNEGLVRERLQEIGSKAELREFIHSRALGWKVKQKAFFARLKDVVESTKSKKCLPETPQFL